jgi:hypothetical protein
MTNLELQCKWREKEDLIQKARLLERQLVVAVLHAPIDMLPSDIVQLKASLIGIAAQVAEIETLAIQSAEV